MRYFPLFADLHGVDILVIGSGPKADEKIARLSSYGAILHRLDRLSPEFLLTAPKLVIAAEEDPEANRRTAEICRSHGIPVNAVDDRDFCDFIFPSAYATDKLTVAVSTGGASPTAAVMIREQIEQELGEHIDEILRWLEELRPRMARLLPDGSRRKPAYRKLFAAALEHDRPLTEEELQKIIKSV